MKRKKIIIILLIIILLTVLSMMVLLLAGCGKNSSKDKTTSQTNSKTGSSSKIVDVSFQFSEKLISDRHIVALMENGDLYANGNFSHLYKYSKYDIVETNVKKFIKSNYFLVLKNNGELEYQGLGLDGGITEEFTKIFDNAVDMSTNGFTIFAIDKNNNLYARFNSYTSKDTGDAGITEDCNSDFVKIKENVKKAEPTTIYESYLYIDVNGKLYLNEKCEETLISENIIDFNINTYSSVITLDKVGTAYLYDLEDKSYTRLCDNVKKISNGYLIDNNNNAYTIEKSAAVKIEQMCNVSVVDSYSKGVYNFDTYTYSPEIEYLSIDGKVHAYVDGEDKVLTESDFKELKENN